MIITWPLDIPKMQKYLRNWYWKHKQVLIFDTFEVRTTKSCGYDVCLWNPDKKGFDGKKGTSERFMFTIGNLTEFTDMSWDAGSKNLITTFDAVRASCTPFYFDRGYFLNTWRPIKTADIQRCAEHFVHTVLDMKYRIWNIKVNDHKEIDLKKEMEAAEAAV